MKILKKQLRSRKFQKNCKHFHYCPGCQNCPKSRIPQHQKPLNEGLVIQTFAPPCFGGIFLAISMASGLVVEPHEQNLVVRPKLSPVVYYWARTRPGSRPDSTSQCEKMGSLGAAQLKHNERICINSVWHSLFLTASAPIVLQKLGNPCQMTERAKMCSKLPHEV